MKNNEQLLKARKLISYISSTQHDFIPVTQRPPYYHMGATIVDSILQAGLNYKSVVYPRVKKLLLEYPQYKTTCDFLILMQIIPLTKLIDWKNTIKLDRITNLSWFLYNNKIETETNLANWLSSLDNIQKVLKVPGMGNKTIDYLKMLSGEPAIAIDRHLFKYLELAGIVIKSYEEANKLYCYAAKTLNITLYELDKKIWTYMSSINKQEYSKQTTQ